MPSGINAETFTRILLGPAVLKVDGVAWGVSRGGVSVSFDTTIRNVPFDCKVADVSGLDRVVGYITRIEGTFLQLGATTLQRIEHGVAGVLSGGVTTTTPLAAQTFLTSGAYVEDLELHYTAADGDVIEISFNMARVVYSGPSGGASDDEATIDLTFEVRQEP
jgi:hypothetical protein